MGRCRSTASRARRPGASPPSATAASASASTARRETRALWPHDFAADLAVEIGGQRLDVALRVRNTGASEFSFTAALHTYLSVSDIAAIRLDGLAGCTYFDRANNDAPGRETAASMTVTQEIDRVYTDIAPPLRLTDKSRALDISQSGFRDCVIWNPGPQRTAKMAGHAARRLSAHVRRGGGGRRAPRHARARRGLGRRTVAAAERLKQA